MNAVNLMGYLDQVSTPEKHIIYKQLGHEKQKYADLMAAPSINTANPQQQQEIQNGVLVGQKKEQALQEAQDMVILPTLLKSLAEKEGGYQDMVGDEGNYYDGQLIGTNHGISAPRLAEYLGRTPTVQDMKELKLETAQEIYKDKYYKKKGVHLLPVELQNIYFQAGVLGEVAAAKTLQELIGVEPDGIIGTKTKEAMHNINFTKQDFADKYLENLSKGRQWSEYGKGWTNRFQDLAKE